MKALNKQLEAARKVVNGLEFGTAEWEAAMEVVRGLVDKINAATDHGPLTSRDGNVWSV